MLPTHESKPTLIAINHQTANTTRTAFEAARPKLNPRQLAINEHLQIVGRSGLTRYELAEKMRLPIQSITGPVRVLLDNGAIVEPGNRRESPHGKPAKVLVLSHHRARIDDLGPPVENDLLTDFETRNEVRAALIGALQDRGDLESAGHVLLRMKSDYFENGIDWIQSDGTIIKGRSND